MLLLAIFAAGVIFVRNEKMQTALVRSLLTDLSVKTGATFKFSGLKYHFFNTMQIDSLCVLKANNDTIIWVERIDVSIRGINFKKRHVSFGNAKVDHLRMHVSADSLGWVNFQFILDSLRSKSTDSITKPWTLGFREINISRTAFDFKGYGALPDNAGQFNSLHIVLNNINAEIQNLEMGRGVKMRVRNLSFDDRCGMIISNLSTGFEVNPGGMGFTDLSLLTGHTQLYADFLYFTHDSWSDWGKGRFYSKVFINASMLPSQIDFDDMVYVIPALKGLHVSPILSGRIRGTFDNLNVSGLSLKTGLNTEVNGDLNIMGLPNAAQSYIYYNIRKLITTAGDIEALDISDKTRKKIMLPENIHKLGRILFKGKFTGFYDDFVAYGTLKTSLGTIRTDVSLSPDSLSHIGMEGRVITEAFDIGKFIDNAMVGKISTNLSVNGVFGSKKGINASMNGTVFDITLNNYNYKNIQLNGNLNEKKYEGQMSIDDPNLVLNFNGSFNLSKFLPEFNCRVFIQKANLYPLHIIKNDSLVSLSCEVLADFVNGDTGTLNGEIKLVNAILTRTEGSLNVKDFYLYTLNKMDTNQIILRSDYADAILSGRYNFSQLVSSFKGLMNTYLPAYFNYKYKIPIDSSNNFNLQVKLKNTDNILKFFYPKLRISENSYLSANYKPNQKLVSLDFFADQLIFNQRELFDLKINAITNTKSNSFDVSISTDEFVYSDKLSFDQLKVSAKTKNNQIDLSAHWLNVDTIQNEGQMTASVNVKSDTTRNVPWYDIEMFPSKIMFKQINYEIDHCHINKDTSAWTFNDFRFYIDKHSLIANGVISNNPDDALNMSFNEIDLNSFNIFARTKRIEINGMLSGTAVLKNLYHEPLFTTDLSVDTFYLNKEEIGKTYIISNWNSQDQRINFNVTGMRGALKTIEMEGSYVPKTDFLDVSIDLNKLRLNILNPYLGAILKDIRGLASGKAQVNGKMNDLHLNGELLVQKGSFIVDVIKTKYSFTTSIKALDNKLLFENALFNDPNGASAYLNGFVFFDKLKSINMDLTISATNFMGLNTKQKDNELFYGTIYASGVVTIKGPPQKVIMEVSAKTEAKSEFYISMTSGEDVTEKNFIKFVGHQPIEIKKNRIQKEKLDIEPSGFELKMDIEATPLVKMEIIFDPKVGDVIRGNGKGNLKMDYGPAGFNIYGTYEIEKGDYLFTLQNLINKKFEVEKGGSITWNGDVYEAVINMVAVYKLKAPLSNLLNDTAQVYKKRVPVECRISLDQKLMKPEISYDISFPTLDAETINRIESAINTDEKKSEQFLSLIVLNNFYKDQNASGAIQQNNYDMGVAGAGVTATELLSNQLSNWFSQISDDVDVGVNWRPGNEVSTDEVELALTTHLLNDRVSINGNLDVGGNQTTTSSTNSTSNIVGDFNVDVKLNKKGTISVKAFNKENDKLIYENSQYTQGVGLVYREEFNSVGDLVNKYWRIITGQKKEN